MIPNYDKDLVIAVSGTGEYDENNVEKNMMDFMLGTSEEREVTLVVPLLSKMSANMKNFIHWAIPFGFRFHFVQTEGAPMTREISALSKDSEHTFIRVEDDRAAIQGVLSALAVGRDAGDDVCFSMFYNPASIYQDGSNPPSDFEIIGEAKMFDWLHTANICEGMQDSFEGYESAEEKSIREKAEAEFAAKMAQEESQKPRRAPRKAAAKKTTTATPKSPEKGFERLVREAAQRDKSHVHYFVWGDDEIGHEGSVCIHCGIDERDFDEKPVTDDGLIDQDHRNPGPTLSATVPLGYAKKDADATIAMHKSLEDDIAAHAPSPKDRQKFLIKQLTNNIQDLTSAFQATLNTLTEMIDELG